MQHLDPESLSLLALGEPPEPEATDHLRSCPSCGAEYSALRRTVVAAKSAPDISRLETPGPHVWAGIHRTLGLSVAVADDPLGPPTATVPSAWPSPARATATPLSSAPRVVAAHPEARPDRNDRGPVRNARPGWLRGPGGWLAAAAATALLAAGVFWSVRQSEPVTTPLATAQLAPVDRHSATGSARIIEAKDGRRTLEVTLNKDEAKGYQEVWLIAPDLSRLVSLGVLTADSGAFPLPAGLDLAEFPIVDVSDEPIDGNPAHSSVSIVRGTLAS
ncbi:anti-sigma factor domain-containing protein [Arthrobacter sp. RHLT1-20]